MRDLNTAHLDAVGDPEIATRIAAYEMAYRMQSSAPELMDVARSFHHPSKNRAIGFPARGFCSA